jgi:hypothetical protein
VLVIEALYLAAIYFTEATNSFFTRNFAGQNSCANSLVYEDFDYAEKIAF